nr:hypothetical transcript [Hymenolepis microstoma]
MWSLAKCALIPSLRAVSFLNGFDCGGPAIVVLTMHVGSIEQINLSRHCDFPSDRTTHLVILILLGQSPSRRLSPFVHYYSHRMYPETDLGVYARGVAPFSYPYNAIPYFQPFDAAPSFCPYGIFPFYPHRTPTLGVIATL